MMNDADIDNLVRVRRPGIGGPSSAIDSRYPVPLVIGVTGHRNLVTSELEGIRRRVREFLVGLRQEFPALPLAVMTPLAEGADRLVALEARKLGIPLIVPLPMPRELYIQDFGDADSCAEFDVLCADAEIIELPLLPGQDRDTISHQGQARNLLYGQLGVFVCAHCHILLALWDGKPTDELGGTGQVVYFHHWDVMPGYTERAARVRQILADDESDLVYHIACSRAHAEGAPAEGLGPLQVSWFTTDDERPRTSELPPRYREIFARTSQFNEDAARNVHRIQREAWSLLGPDVPRSMIAALQPIDQMFGVADWLAIRFQRYVVYTLRTVYTLAVLMGLAFIAYTDLPGQKLMVYAFLTIFALGVTLYRIADRFAWHRKYLDYRALAEGLRVQFYWSCAGLGTERGTKFTHDNFLQKQDVELGWIRNVMRVSGRTGDRGALASPEGLQYTIGEWVGKNSDGSGQLSYYERKANERTDLSRRTAKIGATCLWLGVAVAVVMALFQDAIEGTVFDLLVVLMGILPLIAAVRDAYAQKRAEKELIKQYRFMSRIFGNARRKLDGAANDEDRRLILKALGNAALDEHAEWILMHRERPLEHGKL